MQQRTIITSILGAIARNALKLRYWVVGGAVAGGAAASNVSIIEYILNLFI